MFVRMKKNMTEKQMRSTKIGFPTSMKQLTSFIENIVSRKHDYGTCVYAMSMSAVAAFNYVCHALGTTGFQASCAELDILRRTRMLEDGFMLIDANKLLYPQNDVRGDVEKFIYDNEKRLAKKARSLIKNRNRDGFVHPLVLARWKEIAKRDKV